MLLLCNLATLAFIFELHLAFKTQHLIHILATPGLLTLCHLQAFILNFISSHYLPQLSPHFKKYTQQVSSAIQFINLCQLASYSYLYTHLSSKMISFTNFCPFQHLTINYPSNLFLAHIMIYLYYIPHFKELPFVKFM